MTAGHQAVAQPVDADHAVLVQSTSLTKSFGPTQALADCTFELRAGEVHAIAGENGSGKSTLVKILSGVHDPDGGFLDIAGEQLAGFRTPRSSMSRGIVTVFQEILVAPARSVFDNVWLGAEGPLRAKLPTKEKRARATRALEQILGTAPDLNTPMEELSLSDRQACCIVRALLRDPKILILDEATSALDVQTRDRLFKVVAELGTRGVGVVLITHRMDEIEQIGDRVTVMRSGRTVATLDRGNWTPGQIVRLMSGADERGVALRSSANQDRASRIAGAPVLSVSQLRLHPAGNPIDMQIRAGELVGLAGLEGHGQNEFLEALFGGGPARGEVFRERENKRVALTGPKQAAEQDITYVPRERGRESLFGWMSVRENFGMPTLEQDSRFHWLRPSLTRKRLAGYVDQLGIVLGDADDQITTLSGGNAQKVIIARWLAADPAILLLNDPTRGIDINAKRDLYALLNALTKQGLAIVMLSSEIDEHVDLMDRVLVFHEGDLYKEFDKSQVSRESLVSAYFGDPDLTERGA